MNQQGITAAIDKIADETSAASMGSIDYGTNAKAIALGDPAVRAKLAERLQNGSTLVEIRPLRGFGSSPMAFPVEFVFRAEPNGLISLAPDSLVVSVALPMRSVQSITEGAPPQPNGPGDVPFVLAGTSQFEAVAASPAELESKNRRERAYYESLGVERANPGGNGGGANRVGTRSFRSHVDAFADSGSDTETNGTSDDSGYDDCMVMVAFGAHVHG